MSTLNDSEKKRLTIQYKAVFSRDIPYSVIINPRYADLLINYGIMGYTEETSIKLAANHLKMQNYNKLLTDEIIFSMLKM